MGATESTESKSSLTNTVGLSLIKLAGGNLVWLGEQHDMETEGKDDAGTVLLRTIEKCDAEKPVHIFLESHMGNLAKPEHGGDIAKHGSMGTLERTYDISKRAQTCKNVNFHHCDIRNEGLVEWVNVLKEKVRVEGHDDRDVDTGYRLLDSTYISCKLGEQIMLSQIKRAHEDDQEFLRSIMQGYQKFIQDAHRDCLEALGSGDMNFACMILGNMQDWLINLYIVIRASRKELSGTTRIAYTGDVHRSMVTEDEDFTSRASEVVKATEDTSTVGLDTLFRAINGEI